MHIIDLTHAITPDIPVYPGTAQPLLDVGCSTEADGFAGKKITLFSHTGTLMDVPAHMIAGAKTLDQYLNELIVPHPELSAVHVFKRRFAFTINGCITEIARILINGAAIQTVAVELEDIDAILQAKEMLGLMAYENINYLLAIKRVIGMEPLPA